MRRDEGGKTLSGDGACKKRSQLSISGVYPSIIFSRAPGPNRKPLLTSKNVRKSYLSRLARLLSTWKKVESDLLLLRLLRIFLLIGGRTII